uniref:Uncharacterized protein n=1 Tax=Pithovirus LCPAC403 TaxID=2506596 RepID=A0A481ZBH8_9VIRU|nr:MAG: hypothetical protein LCPAC403_01300 [Pithovirus LCPAC403]
MECKCNALKIIVDNGEGYTEILKEFYEDLPNHIVIKCTNCFEKPSEIWIWNNLAEVALKKGCINTPLLKFIKKKISKKYSVKCLHTFAMNGSLEGVRHIVNHGFDPTSNKDCDWDNNENYASLMINMWKQVLYTAEIRGHSSGNLFEYLQLMLEISEIDADIGFQRGFYTIKPSKVGIPELKVILRKRKETLLSEIREERENRDINNTLVNIDFGFF